MSEIGFRCNSVKDEAKSPSLLCVLAPPLRGNLTHKGQQSQTSAAGTDHAEPTHPSSPSAAVATESYKPGNTQTGQMPAVLCNSHRNKPKTNRKLPRSDRLWLLR